MALNNNNSFKKNELFNREFELAKVLNIVWNTICRSRVTEMWQLPCLVLEAYLLTKMYLIVKCFSSSLPQFLLILFSRLVMNTLFVTILHFVVLHTHTHTHTVSYVTGV